MDDRERRRGGDYAVSRPDLVEAVRELANRDPSIDAVFLFGSRAAGTERASSDVDIAVLRSPDAPPIDRLDFEQPLAGALEERLHVPFDVVLLGPELPPSLLFEIFRVETPLFARDPDLAHAYACSARAEYRDLKPRLDRAYERAAHWFREQAHATQ